MDGDVDGDGDDGDADDDDGDGDDGITDGTEILMIVRRCEA